jgi:hypothetical protein
VFYLHDRTRRFLTQTIFVLFGPILLVSVLGFAVWSRTTAYKEHYERFLSQKIGKTVKIEKIRFPKPNRVKLTQVVISEPETGEILMLVPYCEVREEPVPAAQKRKTAADGILAYITDPGKLIQKTDIVLSMQIPYLATHTKAVPLWKTSLSGILSRPDEWPPIRIHVQNADIFLAPIQDVKSFHAGKRSYQFSTIFVDYRSGKKQSECSCQFQIAGQPAGPRCRILREHTELRQTITMFSTGPSSLPTEVLSLFSPFFANFGTNCQYQGEFQMASNSDIANKETFERFVLKNSFFRRVSLENILKNYVGFPVSGELDQLLLKFASFTDGAIDSIEGKISGGAGMVQRRGLIRIQQRLGLTLKPDVLNQSIEKPVSFENCMFSFAFSPMGAVFTTEGDRPMFSFASYYSISPPNRRISYPDLLASLSTSNVDHVPMTVQSRELLRILPKIGHTEPEIPPVIPPAVPPTAAWPPGLPGR